MDTLRRERERIDIFITHLMFCLQSYPGSGWIVAKKYYNFGTLMVQNNCACFEKVMFPNQGLIFSHQPPIY